MNSIVDLSNTSFESLKADLESWVRAKPDNARWLDFYDSSAGQTIIELVAGMMAYDAYRIGMAERELTLDFALTRTAHLMRAAALGYPVNRPSAPILRITLNSPNSYALWNKEDPIAMIGDYKISLVNSQPISSGTIQLDAYIGCWKEWTHLSTVNEDFTRIYVEDENVDNDLSRFFLEVSSSPVDVTHYAEDLTSTNVLVKTTVEGIFLQFGDGTDGRKLTLEQIDLTYLSTPGRLNSFHGKDTVQTSDIRMNVGTATDVQVLYPGHNGDSNAKIRTLAPAYASTRRSMISKYDHENMILSYAGDLISACVSRGTSPCTVDCCYLFDDEHLMTAIEKDLLVTYLNDFKMAGEQLNIVDPQRIGLDIDMTVIIDESEADPGIYTLIGDIVSERAMKLGGTFFVGEIVRKVSQLDGVLRVYLMHPASDKVLSCREYIAIDNLDVKLTTNADINIQHDPDNTGYISS